MATSIGPPTDISRQFFAYGIFRPGQLGFFQLKPYVKAITESAQIRGSLLLRDGLPIIDPNGQGVVKGALLQFGSVEDAEAAYQRIAALEPEKQYRWDEAVIDGVSTNVLFGRTPNRGSVLCEEQEWNGWNDPLFTAALDVVAETFESQARFEWDLKPSFRLQMAYLLLWSAVERYVSLRYHFRDKVVAKVNQLALEPSFALALKELAIEPRKLYRADDPSKSACVLDLEDPEKSVSYYYQVRSNITHRGKGAWNDHEIVLKSGTELLAIFRCVLRAAQMDARV
jgi:hypothetical protein